MPPIVKLWLCRLKDAQAVHSPDFRELLTNILEHTASYTNPEPGSRPMHAMYQDTNNESSLLMITGYQSQELNSEADRVYAQKYLSRMFEYVQHVCLRQLDLDIANISLDDHLLVEVGADPAAWVGKTGTGNWDIWPQTQQGQNMPDLQKQENSIWVHVSDWNGFESATAGSLPREKLLLKKIASR